MITQNSTPKVAIVTGASAGIGKATAKSLLKAGYTVYCGARRAAEMKDLEQLGAKIGHLDLVEQSSIDKFVGDILAAQSSIDVLVNNAGYGSYGAVEEVALDEARRQFEVNLFGLAAMTNAVLPTMRGQRSGKVIHIGSTGGKLWSILGGWYQASKFALEGLSDCTRNELKPFGIDVILIEPGAVTSEWVGIAQDHLIKTSGNGPYKSIADSAVKFYAGVEDMGVDAQIIADVIMKALRARKPKARYVAPFTMKPLLFLRWILSDNLFDKLWNKMQGVPKSV
jgi:short-subunit dehydrogenase